MKRHRYEIGTVGFVPCWNGVPHPAVILGYTTNDEPVLQPGSSKQYEDPESIVIECGSWAFQSEGRGLDLDTYFSPREVYVKTDEFEFKHTIGVLKPCIVEILCQTSHARKHLHDGSFVHTKVRDLIAWEDQSGTHRGIVIHVPKVKSVPLMVLKCRPGGRVSIKFPPGQGLPVSMDVCVSPFQTHNVEQDAVFAVFRRAVKSEIPALWVDIFS